MDKGKYEDGRRNNRPPKDSQFKPGQSGNPKGRPPKKDLMRRLSMDGLRSFIMNEAYKEVEITEGGRTKTVPKLYVIVSQLYSKAAKGDVAAARLAMKLMETAASQNDEELQTWMLEWLKLRERKLTSERNAGSLEHYNVMYNYYMFKKDMRSMEGEESWPFEDGEPRTDKDWHAFIEIHEQLAKNPKYLNGPWPFDRFSEIEEEHSEDEDDLSAGLPS